MNTIVIKPRSKEEEDFLTNLLQKLDINAQLVEEPLPNYKTKKAISDVERGEGKRVKDSDELFSLLNI
jgi:hypothetical protein